jgi:hypothetical protein
MARVSMQIFIYTENVNITAPLFAMRDGPGRTTEGKILCLGKMQTITSHC